MKPRTLAVHAGSGHTPAPNASSVPIYQTSTYGQTDPDRLVAPDYARGDNPTRQALEEALAALEGGARGVSFPSGMAAISTTFLLLRAGDHVLAGRDLYGGAYRVLTGLFDRWGLQVDFVDTADPQAVADAIRPNTKMLYVETPSNPTFRIADLRALAALARRHGLCSVVDNTFMSPCLQRPLALGFDLSLHSATKFLAGHSDVIGGAAVATDKALGDRLASTRNTFGAVPGPQDCWLTLRGMRTLAVRMAAQQATAGALARELRDHPAVARVHYPGLADHPGHDVHAAQADGPGAVLSFELRTAQAAKTVLRAVKVPLFAVSLGGVESILSYPARMSHAAMSPDERAARGISDALLRLSVGLEDAGDLSADLRQALDRV